MVCIDVVTKFLHLSMDIVWTVEKAYKFQRSKVGSIRLYYRGSGVARSQTTLGHCTRSFLVWGGWGHAPLVNFCIFEVATQMVLETIFEMPSVLSRE